MRLLPSFKPDIPFSRDDANRFLPWIITLMVCLVALLLCIGLTMNNVVVMSQDKFSNTITVQIPHQSDVADLRDRVHDTLEETKGLGKINVATDEAVKQMVAPWLGDGELVKSLPMPTVITVTLQPGKHVDLDALEKQLRAIDKSISLDANELWASKLSQFSQVMQVTLYTLAGFIVATLAVMVIFTARAGMKLHAKTVFLLHAIGADDRYIARQFQYNALRMAATGAFAGTLVAALVYMALGQYVQRLDVPLLPTLQLSQQHIIMLLALPIICGLIGLFSARASALAQLKMLP